MSVQQFGGIEFAMGQVFGIRSWDVDELGRLRGVTHSQVWTPGVNVATCALDAPAEEVAVVVEDPEVEDRGRWGLLRPKAATPSASAGTHVSADITESVNPYIYTFRIPSLWGETARRKHKSELDIAGCSCGFYAYNQSARNDYSGRDHERIDGVIKGYGVTQIGTLGFRCEKAEVVALHIPERKRGALTSRRLVQNYPDIPVFAKRSHLLAEFPLDEAGVLTPDTDTDFWTRSI